MPGHFDPSVLDAFKKNEKSFEEVFETNQKASSYQSDY
jgi:hypothetical protein